MAVPLTISNVWTQNVNNATLTINSAYGLVSISAVLSSGTATFKGGLNIGSNSSQPINMTVGIPVTITSKSNTPLDGLIFDATSGGTVILIGQQ